MTCNQLITLLTIYRGTFNKNDKCHLGTLKRDVITLHENGWIVPSGPGDDNWHVTTLGMRKIEGLLAVLD